MRVRFTSWKWFSHVVLCVVHVGVHIWVVDEVYMLCIWYMLCLYVVLLLQSLRTLRIMLGWLKSD